MVFHFAHGLVPVETTPQDVMRFWNSYSPSVAARQTAFIVDQKITIDPDGDVLLKLDHAELQVSSKAMSLASKVWRVMLSDKYAEGIALLSGQPCRVVLHGDDTDAMVTMCKVLHHRNDQIKGEPSIHMLENLAILADKYDCVEAMSPHSWVWLSILVERCKAPTGQDNIGRLLYPAIIFDKPDFFRKITEAMVYSLDNVGGDKLLTTKRFQIPEEPGHLLPEGLLEAIMAKEMSIKGELLQGLERLIKGIVDKQTAPTTCRLVNLSSLKANKQSWPTNCDCERIAWYLKKLAESCVWPIAEAMLKTRLRQILDYLKGFELKPALDRVLSGEPARCSTCSIDFGAEVNALRLEAMVAFDGFCLDCMTQGKASAAPRACRVKYACHFEPEDADGNSE